MNVWPASGSSRIGRGGGWGIVPQFARVAFRAGDPPDYRYSSLGFRLVRRCL